MRIIFIFKNFKKVFFREAKGDNKKWRLHLFIFGIKIQKCQVLFFNKWGAFFEVETLSFVYYFILVFCYQDLVPSCLWGVYHSKNATSKIAPYLLFLIRACTVMLQLCEHPPPPSECFWHLPLGHQVVPQAKVQNQWEHFTSSYISLPLCFVFICSFYRISEYWRLWNGCCSADLPSPVWPVSSLFLDCQG